MATYSQLSPYYITPMFDGHLDVLEYREIPKQRDDTLYTIKGVHARRPDLLAYDLYGDAGLWWVFAARNPNTIEDPIFDFQEGRTIYVPRLATLKQVLGL